MIGLAIESSEAGKLLMITAEYTADAYSIQLQMIDGELRRYTDDYGNKMGEVSQGALTAPATPATPEDIVGAWYLNSIEMMGVAVHPSMFDMEITMDLAADNTALLHSSEDGDMPGTWAIQEGQVVISAEDGTDILLALIDGNLCGDMGGAGAVFGREKAEAKPNDDVPAGTDAE
jgi:hypothetical protein